MYVAMKKGQKRPKAKTILPMVDTHGLFLLYYLLPKRCFNFQPRKKIEKFDDVLKLLLLLQRITFYLLHTFSFRGTKPTTS